jgi:Icc-related predicted phosphoesterase
MRIVCLSDTHNVAEDVVIPDGDILIHAGDLTMLGSAEEVERAHEWLAALPHPHKVVIAGNHDFLFERQPSIARSLMKAVVYLEDELHEIEGLRIWGSPWQPWFFDWAFNLERGPAIRAKWDLIPSRTDILVTHGPPAGHGDLTTRGARAGCADLLAAVERIGPALHVFGHIHEGYGRTWEGRTLCVNASTCDAAYRPVNEPVTIDWPPTK